MDATCNKCNHWDQAAAQQDNFGECNVLSSDSGSMQFVLPVVNAGQQAGSNLGGVHMKTAGDFGCNQFAAA